MNAGHGSPQGGGEQIVLNAQGIERLSARLSSLLKEAGIERKEALRLRLVMEEALLQWQEGLGPETVCTLRWGKRMGRPYIEMTAPGPRVDPAEAGDGEEVPLYANLMAQAGLAPVYHYRDGENQLFLQMPRAQKLSMPIKLLIWIGAALCCGALCQALPQDARAQVKGALDALLKAFTSALQALSGPMIFRHVCWGMVSMGDMQVMGKVGRRVLLRFLAAMLLITGLTALASVWFFRSGGEAVAGGGGLGAIGLMLLEIIPGDIVTPFQQGNSLQILLMAACVGIALLALGKKASGVSSLMEQADMTVQYIMEAASRYIPLVVFVSLVSLILSGTDSALGQGLKGAAVAAAACVIWPLLYALAVSMRLGVRFSLLLKKLLPTYLIALSTASSAAALSTNLETCRERLGIHPQLTGFGVPLGQVAFKTGAAVGMLVLSMGLAESYGIAISPAWLAIAALSSGLVAIAVPPVPGGFVASYAAVLTQLGIPAEAMSLAVPLSMMLDFFMTSCGLSCLQSELVLSAHSLGMLDKKKMEGKS